MLGRAAGIVAATCVLGANAILLPPGVNSIDDSLSFHAEAAESQIVRVPCSECAFASKAVHVEGDEDGDDALRIQGGAHDILLNFTTSHDSCRLELNGATIFPPEAWSKGELVVVHQVPAVGEDVKTPLEVTSSGLFMDYAQPAQEEQSALVTLRYTILGLEKQLMQLHAVKIELLKVGDELLILHAGVDDAADDEPTQHGPSRSRPHAGGPPPYGAPPYGPPPGFSQDCKMLPAPICRFKHMLETKIAHMRHRKPCSDQASSPRGHGPPHRRPSRPHGPAHYGERPDSRHGRPHHMRPWHRHHGHHHHGQRHWLSAFSHGFIAVLIPVVAGISVGLSVSLLGLAIGRIITFVWNTCSQRQARASGDWSKVDDSVEEGKGLMLADEDGDDEERPPAYEDAPAYYEVAS